MCRSHELGGVETTDLRTDGDSVREPGGSVGETRRCGLVLAAESRARSSLSRDETETMDLRKDCRFSRLTCVMFELGPRQ